MKRNAIFLGLLLTNPVFAGRDCGEHDYTVININANSGTVPVTTTSFMQKRYIALLGAAIIIGIYYYRH